MALNDGSSSIDWAKIVTCDAAGELSPYELAARWADRLSWPVKRTAHDELAELACTSALARWLTRWQPIHIHRALLAGASVQATADALGTSAAEACRSWYEWAIRQRESIICGRRGVSTEEYATVAQIFTAARVELPDIEAYR